MADEATFYSLHCRSWVFRMKFCTPVLTIALALVSLLPQYVAQQVALHKFYKQVTSGKFEFVAIFAAVLWQSGIITHFFNLPTLDFFLSQKFMPTLPCTTIPALKEEISRCISETQPKLYQTEIENFFKRMQVSRKADEDICQMCCSIHNLHMSILWLSENFGIF